MIKTIKIETRKLKGNHIMTGLASSGPSLSEARNLESSPLFIYLSNTVKLHRLRLRLLVVVSCDQSIRVLHDVISQDKSSKEGRLPANPI